MARRLEVRITYCCCCGLTLATIFIAIYTLILYTIFLGFASHAVWRMDNGVADPGRPNEERTVFATNNGNTETVVVIDPYFDSLGLYLEELKFTSWSVRRPVLAVNIIIYLLMILASILVFIAVCTGIHFLLVPWMVVMCIDIIRGILSCIFIFIYADGEIRKVAVGIFFLGLQLFHMALVLIIFAKFLRMLNKKQGVDYKVVERGDRSILMDGSQVYPTLPGSAYAYSSSPQYRREGGYYQPQGPNYPYSSTFGGEKRAPSEPDGRRGPPQGYYNGQPQVLDPAMAARQHKQTM